MDKETIEHIIYSFEKAQKQRELGFDIPPFRTPEEHLMVIAYWKLILQELVNSDKVKKKPK